LLHHASRGKKTQEERRVSYELRAGAAVGTGPGETLVDVVLAERADEAWPTAALEVVASVDAAGAVQTRVDRGALVAVVLAPIAREPRRTGAPVRAASPAPAASPAVGARVNARATWRTNRAVLTNGHTGHVPRAPGFVLF